MRALSIPIEVEEIAKEAEAEAEAIRKQAKMPMKLASTSLEIENLKKEVNLSQSEVAFLNKQVETLDVHHKLAAEALERANKENVVLKQWVGELDSSIAGPTKEVECVGGSPIYLQ